MFIGFSKTLARFGGFRIGLGLRLTKKNAIWMLFVLMLVYLFKAIWYLMILYFWLIYAVIYWTVYGIKKLCQQRKDGLS